MAPIAPAHIVAAVMALFGVGLVVFAFVGAGFDAFRLVFGIALIVAAFITAGLQLLNRNVAPTTLQEEG